MNHARWVLPLAAIMAAGAGGYWLGQNGTILPQVTTSTSSAQTSKPAPSGPVIYYRDP